MNAETTSVAGMNEIRVKHKMWAVTFLADATSTDRFLIETPTNGEFVFPFFFLFKTNFKETQR